MGFAWLFRIGRLNKSNKSKVNKFGTYSNVQYIYMFKSSHTISRCEKFPLTILKSPGS